MNTGAQEAGVMCLSPGGPSAAAAAAAAAAGCRLWRSGVKGCCVTLKDILQTSVVTHGSSCALIH